MLLSILTFPYLAILNELYLFKINIAKPKYSTTPRAKDGKNITIIPSKKIVDIKSTLITIAIPNVPRIALSTPSEIAYNVAWESYLFCLFNGKEK